ncbi:group III truncated hemoglobin [Bradyrhizobium sp. WSM 1704]|uniref:group III truncated hemoglobin n=1 Tax=Bradyrhizobium semiaridum TaxID=2821404 RepID=UPI001CE3048E|nr:group III truncated hemoglobin [Bradyrhizobium semiaridum]MCA6124123.1 group III truncated hemoglobin [Bradyrhizobium semiaridum]
MTEAERRDQITAGIVERTGITETMIEQLVHGFYARVRSDPMLAPVFEARIADWEPHLVQMCAFWSSVALTTGRYHGTPMVKHMKLPVDAAHFDRWLELFEAAAHELCPPVAATHFVERARRIAASLEMGVASGQGVMLGVGERFRSSSSPTSPREARPDDRLRESRESIGP